MKRSLICLVFLTAMLGIFSSLWAQTTLEVPSVQYPTIQAAINAAVAGDIINVAAGTYTGNITINKSITLISASGAAVTILDGVNANPGQGTIEIVNNVNNLQIGSINHGFTVKGLDGLAGAERSGVYFAGSHNTVVVEGNVLEARGDSAIQGEWSASNVNFTINSNVITGKTFLDDNPGGVGFDSQFTTANVPRQLVVFGGGAGNTNTQNFAFTNNIVSGICGGYNTDAEAYQGNQLVTLDLSGENNVITGNTFNGYTTYTSAALRTRGDGTHTISGNIFNGTYPVNYTAMTTILDTRLTRTAAVYANNTFSKAVVIRDNLGAIKYGEIPTLINYAIDKAVAGQEVFVASGTYNEHVMVNKSVSLLGANRETTIINGGETGTGSPLTGSVVIVTANNCTISGFSVTGTPPFVDLPNNNDEIYYAGIGLFNVTGCTVTNNKVYESVVGIAGAGGTLNSITHNLISTCGIGVAIDNADGSGATPNDGATYFTVSNNTVSYMQATGIYVAEDCDYATVSNNTVSYCGETGIYFWKSSHSSASNNTVSSCNTGFENFASSYNTFSSNTIQSNTTDGIRVEHGIYGIGFEPSSTYMTIQGNTVSGNGEFGIKLSGSFIGTTTSIEYTQNNVVQNNIVHHNLHGIALGLGQDSSIKGNAVHDNTAYGILLIASTDNTVELNNVYGNGFDGIALDNANVLGGPLTAASTLNFIKTNTISSNRDGIFIGQNCNQNSITDNNTITAVHSGIHIWRSDSQTVSENTITNCVTGDEDEPGHGIRLYAASNNTISGNTLTGNAEGMYIRNFYDPAPEPDVFIPSLNNAIHDNNISGNLSYGLHSDNFSNHGVWSVVDATNNWWGANDGPAWKDYVNASVAGGGAGNAVTYVQYNGANVVTYDPYDNHRVYNVNKTAYYNTIQAAIDAANPNDVINVIAGTYIEYLTVDKPLDLRGPNFGISPNTRARVPEAIIMPPSFVEWGNGILFETADGSSIDGFTLNGDNPLVTEQVADTATGIGAFDGMSGMTISNNIIKNYYYDGIELYNYPNDAMTTGNIVTNNKIENIYSVDYGIGVLLYNNCYADVIDNVITGVRVGIQTGNYHRADSGESRDLQGNTIQASRNGIFHNLMYSSASTFNVSANTISVYNPTGNNVTSWHGIRATSLSVPSNLSGNIISGAGASVPTVGYMIWNNQTAPIISGGTVSNIDTGINVNNYEGYNSIAGNTYATISDVDFALNANGTGIYVHDNPANTTTAVARLTIGEGVTVTGGANGIMVDGPEAMLISPLGDIALNTQSQFYFELIDNSNDIDATAVTYDGILAADMTTAQLIDLEAKIYHHNDLSDLGLIILSNTDLYVTTPEALIKDNETRPFTVLASYLQDLRGYTVRIQVSKTDYLQPTDFVLGSSFIPDENTFWQEAIDLTNENYWIYDVTNSKDNNLTPFISGADIELFSFNLTSRDGAQNLTGSPIDLPLVNVVLIDEMNQYITCSETTGYSVIIDSGHPALSIAPDSGYLVPVATDGSGALVLPSLSLAFSDNYNLANATYLIQGALIDPPLPIAITTPLVDIDGLSTDDAWPLVESTPYVTGTYTLYILVTDDAGNTTLVDWDFVVDRTAPGAIVWEADWTEFVAPCRTTPNANNSISLMWDNPDGTVKNHIWYLSYSTLSGVDPAYPEYPNTTTPIPAAPDPYLATDANWVKVIDPAFVMGTSYVWTGMPRDYYYVTIFAEDAAGNISAASQVKESISYWPGDVSINSAVDTDDISILSLAWGQQPGNNLVDVGPTVGRARRGRPIPDNRINIEDLMIFSMNYANTNYGVYERTIPELNPIRIEMLSQCVGDQLIVTLNLGDNNGFVKGLNIPILYGTGLSLLSVESGSVWPENSLLLHRNADNIVELSASALGDEIVENNGLIATLTFNISGTNSSLELQHMIARTIENTEIEIIDNPQETPSGNEDPESIIPVTSYLGANYPNPFNPTTTIQFGLNQTENVRISIFNSRGQMVKTLVNGVMSAGTHNVVWNGMDNNNRSLGSGLYFYRMETKNYSETKKAILIK